MYLPGFPFVETFHAGISTPNGVLVTHHTSHDLTALLGPGV